MTTTQNITALTDQLLALVAGQTDPAERARAATAVLDALGSKGELQAKLKEMRQAAVVEMRDKGNASHGDVAKALGISRSRAQQIAEGRSKGSSPKPARSVTTTSYGTFYNHAKALNPESYVAEALTEYADDYDFDGLVAAFREAINAQLPDGVVLAGDEFIGPAYPADRDWDPALNDEDGHLDIATLVERIDFWALAEKFDRTSA
jgi:DNA-binding transcriptional regulator YiaG